MPELLPCPDVLPEEVCSPVKAIAKIWALSEIRPKFSSVAIEHWNRLIVAWIGDDALPLYVRKFRGNRGQRIRHSSGRFLVPTDNSPAHWSFVSAYSDNFPTLANIKVFVENDEIPVAMAMSRQERLGANYTCSRSALRNPNELNWKLCHKNPVALNIRGEISQAPLDSICRHFSDFMSPSNMFLVPKSLSGLGELPDFIDVMKNYT